MSLLDWTTRDVNAEVREIAGAQLSDAECKEWARDFIRSVLPWWDPRDKLYWPDAQTIGAAFENELRRVRRRRGRTRAS